MKLIWGAVDYESRPVEDAEQGCVGFELLRIAGDTTTRVAQILFWDAAGQFAIETFNTDVPLEVIEELIAEARSTIKVQ